MSPAYLRTGAWPLRGCPTVTRVRAPRLTPGTLLLCSLVCSVSHCRGSGRANAPCLWKECCSARTCGWCPQHPGPVSPSGQATACLEVWESLWAGDSMTYKGMSTFQQPEGLGRGWAASVPWAPTATLHIKEFPYSCKPPKSGTPSCLIKISAVSCSRR